jgi:cytochrome c-type biogenesis protein CcmF
VRSGGREIATMEPARLFYKRPQQPATRVAIRSTPLADLYVVLAGVDDQSGLATFEVFLTPLVFWLWAGGLMMAIGTVVVMWPNVRERAAMAAALGRDEALGAEPVPGGD